ncbi:HlyD family secretion protein [Flagellimonas flava]|uniref:Multidrug resistance efflux pump n=1 Tax=Flagellimonas flava TaxID=570519 RepID=A0A1M5M0I2_9FLAO|nr:HlyD family efflux transporter periplasmic adaptor subunit [Allomuricauda flava]SHG70439.1 Multidrug resistance efflux pump [Allomuricauda flava]
MEQSSRHMDNWDERSDQVREILGKAPNWVIRFGTTVIFVIFLLLLFATSIISYNDIIPAQIIVTSKNPPVHLKSKSSGKLANIFVEPGQFVIKDQRLGEIENTANIEDIYYLLEKTKNLGQPMAHLDSLKAVFPPHLEVGEVQSAYGDFITRYQDYILYNSLTPNKKESAVISKQLMEQKFLLAKQQEQLLLIQEDLKLSNIALDRSKRLFEKGVISKAEHEGNQRKFLLDKQQYEGFRTGISNTQIAIASFNNLLTKSNIEGMELKNSHIQQLEKAHQNLINSIMQWEHKYIFKSPITGKVTVFDIWNKYQNVSIGQTVFTVVPRDNLDGFIGRVTLPIQNSGKVRSGQRVIVKLDNYPFQEWGSLEGKVQNISEVPKQDGQTLYTLYIEIKSLTTSFDKKINFRQEMQGTAEVVVEELSILQRIFYHLRKTFSR